MLALISVTSALSRPMSVLSVDTSALTSAMSFSSRPTRSSNLSIRVFTSVRKVRKWVSVLVLMASSLS